MADAKVVVCPYCGAAQTAGRRCGRCKADFGALTRRATQNQMGPWYVRDEENSFRPGCSYESIVKMIDAGQVSRYSIIRGPTTSQLWTVARKTPGVAHLLGDCHHCNGKVEKGVTRCPDCRTVFGAWLDRNHLGLPELRPMPGDPDESLDTFEPDEQFVHGFRPLSSEGLSAFLHVDEAEPGKVVKENIEEEDDANSLTEVDSVQEEESTPASIFDQAMRAELSAARRHSNRMTILAVVAIIAAVGTLLIALLMKPKESVATNTEASVIVVQEKENAPLQESPELPDLLVEPDPSGGSVSSAENTVDLSGKERAIARLIGQASDTSLTREDRLDAIEKAQELLAELRELDPSEAGDIRFEEYAETLDRAQRRLDF